MMPYPPPEGTNPVPLTTTNTGPVEVYTSEWWLRRLLDRLIKRSPVCAEFYEFYEGKQRLMFASQKFVETFGPRFGRFPANFMPMVVDAESERLVVDGFRFGAKPEADRGVWKIWQANQLDAESQIAHEIALVKGVAYVAVDPFDTDDTPTITIEDPSETIVETAPGNRRLRLAALKVYTDDDGYARAYLYLPDEVYRYRSEQRRTDATVVGLAQMRWQPMPDVESVVPNPLRVVPIVPLINRPRRDGTGRSELEPVMGNQLAINFLRYAALVGSDSAALPQRWAKNLDIPIDEDTGKPVNPFTPGQTLWVQRRPTPEESAEYGDQVPEAAFGQFPEASLEPFVRMIRQEVGQMASNSRTPYHYLLGEPTSVPPSGEAIHSSEAPLVKKVERAHIHLGEGWEEVMRVALIAAGQSSKAQRAVDAETVWRDAETRNEAARTDSILKQYQQGLLPDEFALELLGYTPQQIERVRAMKAANPPAPPAPPAPDTTQSAAPPTA